jgi:hypothetical protein
MTSTTTRLRSVNPVQLAIVLGLIYAVLAFLVAILFLIFGSMLSFAFGSYLGHMGIFNLVLFPVGYFIAGFIGGLIAGALFNLVAGWTGGIELTFETQP